MEPARNMEEYQAQLAQIRSAAHKRRAEAWAMVPETVLGLELNPITPAIYSLLVGTGNAYLTGRVPKEADLRNFVWFCSPQFNPDKPTKTRWRALQMWRLDRAMSAHSTRTTRAERITENFYRACLQIHKIIDETFCDTPFPAEENTPVAASLESSFIDTFAREYMTWPLTRPVRHTPIKQLNQLSRCIDRRYAGKDDKYYDRDENIATAQFLGAMNVRN